MLIVHLFVSYAHVDLCIFSLPPGVRGWQRLLLVALPGLFCLLFSMYLSRKYTHTVIPPQLLQQLFLLSLQSTF